MLVAELVTIREANNQRCLATRMQVRVIVRVVRGDCSETMTIPFVSVERALWVQ